MKEIIDRKNGIVERLSEGVQYLLDKNKISVIKGRAVIKDPETIVVESGEKKTTISSKHIIIATGAKTTKLNIPGIDTKNTISSSQALSLDKLPPEMVIIGGGIIGMEFAFIFANLGTKVSVVEAMDSICFSLDDDVIKTISMAARRAGIKIYAGSKVEAINETEDKQSLVSFINEKGVKKYLSADKVLLAVGRTPYTGDLGIEELKIELNDNNRGIKVNEKMQTSIQNIYAIGDVTDKVQLAHVASHQGVIAVKNILGRETIMDYSAVPSAIFTDPEIAVVGLTEKAAQEQKIPVTIGKFPFSANGKALTLGESRGFVKIVKEKDTGMILGGTIIGPHASDLIAELTLAVKNKLTEYDLIETIHAHPTTAEAIHEAALDSTEEGALHFFR